MDAPVDRTSWRYRLNEARSRLWCWLRCTTFNQRAAAVLAVFLIGALVRSEIRTTAASRRATDASHKATTASHEVRALLVHQTANRVANVKVWCDAINGLEGLLVAYVAAVPGAPSLKVVPLDCPTLEHGTKASTR